MSLNTKRLLFVLISCFFYIASKAQCTPTITAIPPTCGGFTGYQITIPPCAAPTPYTLSWSSAGGCSSPTLLTVPGPGTYTTNFSSFCSFHNLFLFDATSSFIGAAFPFIPVLNFGSSSFTITTSTPPLCFGNCNGSQSGFWNAAGPITLTLDPGAGQTVFTNVLAGFPVTYPGLCAGTHTFNVLDANNCSTSGLTFTLGQPALLTATSAAIPPSCNGGSNGIFNVTSSGGTAPFTVIFSNGSTVTAVPNNGTASATGLSMGVISATVTDTKGCTTTASATIVDPNPILIAQTQTILTCNSVCTGAASVAVSGGGGTYSYSWSPNTGTMAGITGLCATVIHTVNILDNNNCLISRTFTLTEPPAITLTPTSTNVVCSGSCTGAASISPLGGTAPFTYTWVAPGPVTISTGTASSLSNLCSSPSSYSVIVKDGNNCSNPTVLINITQPPTVTLSIVTKSVSCFGLADGGATVTATGGNSSSYTYTWSPGAFTSSAVNTFSVGVYNLTVNDALACPTSTNVSIIQPASGLSAIVSHTNITCFGGCDGIINSISSGGTPPLSYTLASGTSTIFSAPPYTSICSGTYNLITKDASGCFITPSAVITPTQPVAPVTSTITVTTPIACFGTSVGVITGMASGGTGPYTYFWTTPTGTVAGNILSGIAAQVYTLSSIDTRSCTTPNTFTFTSPTQMSVTVSPSSILCFSACNGSITSTVAGGTAPYTYSWVNVTNSVVSTNSTATSLCPGQYTLTVTDFALCTRTILATVLSPPPIVLTTTTNPVNCFGDFNGSATVTASGGTPPYSITYTLASATSTNLSFSGVFGGLPAGTYTAFVRDNPACLQSTVLTVNSPTALTAVISGTNSCNVCNGLAAVSPTFGTGPYTYTWSSATSANFANTSTVSGLCPDTYTATIVDSKGCSITRTISIIKVVNIGILVSPPTIICNSATTGIIQATVTSGIGPFSYTWTPSGQNTPTLTNVGAGTYTLFVTDSSTPLNCSSSVTAALIQPPAITITPTQTNVTCFGFSNGAISTTVAGGTGAFTYSWSPGTQTTSAISGLAAGNYTLLVRDVNLCPSTRIFTVTQSPSITITFTPVNPTGCTSPNGSICTGVSGGSGSGYTYAWSPVTGTTNCISGLGGGTYQHTVTDGAGCSNTVAINLVNATGPTLTAVSRSVDCFGASTGAATVTAAGTAPFTFSWSPAATTSTIINGNIATGLSNGVYIVSCTDFSGCVTSTIIPIAQSPSVTISQTVTPARCFALCDGSIRVNPSQGTLTSTSFTYSWLPLTPTISGQGTSSVTNLCSNPYTLNLTDIKGCLTQYTFSVNQPSVIAISAVTTSLLCNNACTGSIIASASGGIGALNYSWTPIGGNTGTVTNLCATGGTNAASYTLTVTDTQTCSTVSTFTLAQPPALTSTVNLLNASCSNSCNAIATVTAGGGVPGYSYSWSSGTVTTSSIGGLCSSTGYTSTVTDNNGCFFVNQFTTTLVSPLSLSLNPSNPLCNAACNGSITTTVSGAQGSVNYTWSPAGSGQSPTGLCAVPNPIYTVVARDQNSCEVVATATLVNPLPLTATVNAINPVCYNDANGSATVIVTNAVGATSYTWVPTGPPTQTAQTATNLIAGIYTVMVKDNNQCQTTHTFSLINPSSITVNSSSVSPSCNLANGSITLSPSGGTPGSPTAYTFSWTTLASTSSVVTTVTAGAYPVLVTDGLGCTTSVSILLINANGPTHMPVISSSIICNAQCTGAASVDVLSVGGGTGPYEAIWISPSSTVNALTGLCAGSYTAEVIDAVGCINFTNVTIAEPPPIVPAPSIGLPLCPNNCTGTISLNTSGGNAPYSYTWSPIPSNSPSLTGLCAGDYTVTIGYNGVCTSTASINIANQSSITIVPTITNNICFGNCNGVVSLSVTGGTTPYNASWSNSQSGLIQTALCNGSYTVSITDNNGCNNTATASITSGAQITSSTSVVSPSCGLCDGTASVSVSGGTSPFTFNWSNAATTPTVANMCAGIYQVVVKDALLCSQTHTVIVNNSNGITGETINLQDIPCSGSCTGAATVTAIGGNAPISYNWVSPAVSNSIISNLCPGTYFLQMSDAQNCIRITSVTINPLVTLTVSPFVQQPACGFSTGVISLAIAGGTPSYTILWNPPAGNTTSITGLNSGVYSYTVIESSTNSCSISQVINMSNSNGPVLAIEQSNANCFDACTGFINIAVTSTSTPINFLWSNGSTLTSVTNLCPGIITLTVTDVGLCKTIRSFTITDNPQLRLGFSNVQNPSCFGDCDGAITLVPSGGILPYTYSWTPIGSTVNPISSLCDGTYSATVIDSKGCKVSSPNFTIASGSRLILAANTSSSSCSSVNDGSVSVTPSGGVVEYVYLWQGPSGFTATTQNITNVFSGVYSVTVTDNLGCRKDSVLEVVPSITIVARAGADAIICAETGTTLITGISSSGSANYRWYNILTPSVTIANGSSFTVSKLIKPETYVLVATATVASCFDSDTVSVDLYPVPFVDAGRSYTVPIYTSVGIGGNPTSLGAFSVTWSPAFFLNDANLANPVASNTLATMFTVTITDINGCVASDSVFVDLYPELNISSGFTPNGDGKNDLWIIDYIDQFPDNTVEIVNRWGDKVFSSNGYLVPFDGKYKDKELPVGTYYYIINVNHPGYPKPITGPLTIFR